MADHSYSRLVEVFETWWHRMNATDKDGGRGDTADRADAARLRRVDLVDGGTGPRPDIATALTVESFRRLHQRTRHYAQQFDAWEESLVAAAIALAHVRTDVPGRTTAMLLGGNADADQRLMADARFLRLIRAGSSGELMDQGRRLVALLKGAAPVGDLGASLLLWLDDPNRRREWARAFYGLTAQTSSTDRTSNDEQPQIGSLQP
jgi:hypothetical protein